jgi:hypothetical protein
MIPVGILTAASTSSLNPVTVSFDARVTAAGGTLSNNEKTAVNTLVNSLQSNGIWNSMVAIYPMVGASAASCAQNLVSSSFTGTFVNSWTFSSNGATPNGVNAYMNTNLIPYYFLSINSSQLSVYSRTNTTTGSQVDIGSSAASKFYIIINFGGATYLSVNTATDLLISTITDTRGFFEVARTTSSLQKMYVNGSVFATSTLASTTDNLDPVFLGCLNFIGNPSFFSAKQFAFCSLGFGLNDSESSNFYTAVQAFQTTLGRQV